MQHQDNVIPRLRFGKLAGAEQVGVHRPEQKTYASMTDRAPTIASPSRLLADEFMERHRLGEAPSIDRVCTSGYPTSSRRNPRVVSHNRRNGED